MTEKEKLEEELAQVSIERAEIAKTVADLKRGPQTRQTLEETECLKEKDQRLVRLEAELQRALERATLQDVLTRYEQKLEETGKQRQQYQKELDDFVENCTEREKEILGRYGITAFSECAVLLNKINALNENCKYYFDELSIINRQLQKLA